jgi:translation initiation factor 3 subunit B
VTWSPDPIVVPEGAPVGATYFSEEDEGNQIAVWEIRTGHLLRTFPAIHQAPSVDAEGNPQKKQMIWPALKWSADDKYVARVTPGQQISIYELPSMSLLGKKSVKIEGVVDFEWCPLGDRDRDEEAESKKDPKKTPKKERENMLAYWTPEISNQPARVTLMSFPSRTVLRSKNLFNVSDVSSVLLTVITRLLTSICFGL